jgi:Asp-tRNA(Asn)/Glu-tRNA(Gln) amidotransferase A subunit family amidase
LTTAVADAGDLPELSAGEAVAAMARGDITAERYAAALLQRCQAGRSLNAFITLEPEQVLAAARACDRHRGTGSQLGPLHGLPVPIKDSVNTRQYPTTAGTNALRGFRPKQDAAVVRALLGAGAIVLGKTNLHELSFGWTSDNQAFGPVRNPYDTARIAGGSSGGTAAAVAARMAPLGVAADTEGSIRVPAAFCGIAGFRPTIARYPNTGVAPISALFDQVGPHARSVADLLLFDSVVASEPAPMRQAGLAGVRLAVDRDYWFTDLHPEVERIATQSLRKLQDAGAQLVEAHLPGLTRLIELTTSPIQNHDFVPAVSEYLERYQAGVSFEQLLAAASDDVKHDIAACVFAGGRYYASDSAYQAARDVYLPELREAYRSYFARTAAAAIVFPTTMIPPPLIGEKALEVRGRILPFRTAVARNISPASTAGLPGLVLPAGLTAQGLPVSLEFDGPVGTDRILLGLGLALEAVLGRLPAPALQSRAGSVETK